jgi:GntR family transcriptional regulator
MISVNKQSPIPFYEQIKNQVLTLIRLGVLAPGAQIPSIRSVSAETGVNVNTVKKAFAELEMSGVIYTVPGLGSFVSEQALENYAITQKVKSDIAEILERAKSIGVSKEEVFEIIENIYREEKI